MLESTKETMASADLTHAVPLQLSDTHQRAPEALVVGSVDYT